MLPHKEAPMKEPVKNPTQEIDAMRAVADALKDLDPEAQRRVLKWAADAFQADMTSPARLTARPSVAGSAASHDALPSASFSSLAELFALAQPAGEAEKALVAAYWFQVLQGEQDFDSQKLNTELKHLGHGILNITQALTV